MLIDSTFAGSMADVFGRMPAAVLLVPFLPPRDLMSKKTRHDKLTVEKINARMAKPNNRPDFFSHLLSDDTATKYPQFYLSNASTKLLLAQRPQRLQCTRQHISYSSTQTSLILCKGSPRGLLQVE